MTVQRIVSRCGLRSAVAGADAARGARRASRASSTTLSEAEDLKK